MDRRRFSVTTIAGTAGLFSMLLGRKKAAAQGVVPQDPTLETWARPRRRPPLLVDAADTKKLARQIWESYGLASPNHYDTEEAFCSAILSDWARNRSAYVWRYASTSGSQVYVLPGRFVLKHPAFLPDFPEGYYRLDPACEADDAQSCIHPSAFFRILSAESVDEYAPGEVTATRRV
ncbi:MAG TPA: hypothetical protein VGJ69_11805 [Pyrinomonadaceae bacterium]